MTYLRPLFWLKWTLLWRGYRRSKSAVFGVVVALLFFLPLALGLAAGCAFGFLELAPPYNEHLLRGVLLAIYGFWVLVPLLGYALTDSYDITKLFVYPLSVRQIFTGAILGSVIDFPVLLLLPVLLAALIGFTHGALSLLLVLPALGLFLFHTLSLSQAMMLASAGVLRSRRFRDLATVLIPLFWMGYYALRVSLSRGLVSIDWARFLQSRTWELLGYLPPGFAARAIAAAGRGETVLALGFLLGLFAFAAVTVAAAGWLVERVYAGEAGVRGQGSGVRKAGERERGKAKRPLPPPGLTPDPRPLTPSLARLPPVVAAVAEKEFRYLYRDPYFKIVLMNVVYLLFVGAFLMVGRPERAGEGIPPAVLLWSATAWMLFAEIRLLFNSFGTEGAAAVTLFLFPSSRRQIIIGKNLTLFAALSVVNLVFIGVLAGFSGALGEFGPLGCWMELATLLFIAVGNLASIWFPVRVVLRGWRVQQQSASRGFGYMFLYLALAAAGFALLIPVLAAVLLPTFWVSPAWYTLSLPLAVAYALGMYALSLRWAAPLLLEREPILIERLCQEE